MAIILYLATMLVQALVFIAEYALLGAAWILASVSYGLVILSEVCGWARSNRPIYTLSTKFETEAAPVQARRVKAADWYAARKGK